jgi:general stress protein 26
MEKEDELTHLMDIARNFRVAMLVTLAEGGRLHGRPMTIAEIDDEAGTLWFLTSKGGESSVEIAKDSRAVVTMQSSDAYVQWSGRASLEEDSLRVHEIWQPTFLLWFPNGVDDPKLQLVRFDVEIAEYWDRKGTMKVRALLRRARRALQGQETTESTSSREQSDSRHGRIHVHGNGER